MPRSFLVKKNRGDDERPYQSYRVRDLYHDPSDSLKAAAPYTPAILPLAVRVSNGGTENCHPPHAAATSKTWYTMGCWRRRGTRGPPWPSLTGGPRPPCGGAALPGASLPQRTSDPPGWVWTPRSVPLPGESGPAPGHQHPLLWLPGPLHPPPFHVGGGEERWRTAGRVSEEDRGGHRPGRVSEAGGGRQSPGRQSTEERGRGRRGRISEEGHRGGRAGRLAAKVGGESPGHTPATVRHRGRVPGRLHGRLLAVRVLRGQHAAQLHLGQQRRQQQPVVRGRRDRGLHLRRLLHQRRAFQAPQQQLLHQRGQGGQAALQVQRVRQGLRHVVQPVPAQADAPQSGQQAGQEVSALRQGLRVHARALHAHPHARPQAQVHALQQGLLAALAVAGTHALPLWREALWMCSLRQGVC